MAIFLQPQNEGNNAHAKGVGLFVILGCGYANTFLTGGYMSHAIFMYLFEGATNDNTLKYGHH